MNSYHRLWLSLLVLAIVTTSMCGFANEHDVSENANLKLDAHNLEAQAAASLKEMTDSDLSGDSISIELHRSLRFEPPQLDFGIWSVGTVRSHTVTLVNLNRNRSVYLSSVSGRTPAFYSSFFEAKMVPPNGNTTFNVVFLPREKGAISTSLHIHTSFGKLKLLVRGEGRECPYRLKPLVGIKAPLNATLMPEIHMYNPHEKALQILEVYSSGGQFQLELPSGDPEAPQGLWEIPPFTTKPVIRIRFQGFTAGNHSAYIRIKIAEPHNKTNSSSTTNTEEQVLVIPVEFEILPQYGVYAVNPLLEFGYVTVDDVAKPLEHKLSFRHSKNQLEITDLEFKSLTYILGVHVQGNNVIVLDPNVLMDPVVRLNEKLELVLKDTTAAYTYHNVELIIRADIFKGILHYDTNKTIFLTHKSYQSSSAPTTTSNKQEETEANLNDERLITVRNDFQIPMAIYNVTTNHNDSTKLSLQIKPFETGMVLKPGLSFDLFMATRLYKLHEQNEDLKDLANYKTAIYVYTNITNFEIPLVISSARLFVTTQTLSIWRSNISVYTKELNFGSIPLREMSHKGFIIFQNRNSIPIKLNNWDVQRGVGMHISLYFLGCAKAATINKTNDYVVDLEQPNFKFSSHLEEGDIAVYQAMLQPYKADENLTYFDISTQYENITISLKYSTALGRLEVDQEKLHFANCFPGKLCSSELSIRSTFKHPIHIKYIKFTDPGLKFEDKNAQGSKIAPQTVTTVGRIFFKPSALCGSRCYIQQHTEESVVFPSMMTGNTLNIPNFDEFELRRRTELYRHFKYYFQNMDFTLTTKEMQHFQLNLMIELQWPQLVQNRQPLAVTEVNNAHIQEVKIFNPSDNPILIDYMLADPTLAIQTQISLPLEVVVVTPSCYLTDKEVFSLVNSPPKQPVLIPGLSSVTIPIKFLSDTAGTFCSLLNIRNNLTLFEGVWISGKTVQSQFRLGNRKPGSTTPLLFEISEQHLNSACPAKDERIIKNEKLDILQGQPQVISRRVFTARNSGELPISIEGFWIGDQPCKGYGFQVMDCSKFELKANSSKKIEISFQSDFTVTRISRPLTLKTNLSYEVRYLLVAQLPSKGLEKCMVLLPRPPWEEKIRNAAIVMLIITFVLVLVAVHIDYGNIIYNQSVLYEARDKGTVHPTFNLRNIAMRSTQNNNESSSSAALTEPNNKNHKLKLLSTDKSDSSSTAIGLKKRNVLKNSKTLNGDVTRNTMSLAEMVSWTFGKKTSKKSLVINKNDKSQEPPTNVTSPAVAAVNETKSVKTKMTEKYIIAKMDGDMKKSQTSKKSKATEKPQNSKILPEKSAVEEVKLSKDDQQEKDIKKGKNSPKAQTKVSNTSTSETNTALNATKEPTKPLETTGIMANLESVTQITDKNVHLQTPPAKDLTNNRKVGKTPGRERRKQTAQNTSPVTSDVTSSSSSTSSSCSSHHNNTAAAGAGKRYVYKPKNKATNSLKFSYQNNNSNSMFPSTMSSSSPSPLNQVIKPETSTHMDILTPWDCGQQVSFSDVLQKTQQQQQLTMTNSTDLTQQTHSSLFDLMPPHSHSYSTNMAMENSEIKAALTPKRTINSSATTTTTNSPTDLGPIGSRKSPSSTPVWEPLNSAITMQLPRPLNTSSTSTSPSYYPIHTNFGYQDLATMQSQISPTHHQQHHQLHQHHHHPHQTEFVDITAQLLELKKAEEELRRQWQRQLLEQQHLQHQQQQQTQFLNSSLALNNNWSNLSSPLWTPILGNGSSTANTTHTSSAFAQPQTQNSTWSINPSSSSSPSGLVRPPPGLEQNFNSLNNNMTTPMQNHQTLPTSASVASSLVSSSSSFNNTIATSSSSNGLTQTTQDNDNMPMFNLFGGLSSIWNDNWKQSTSNQQQQQQPPPNPQ